VAHVAAGQAQREDLPDWLSEENDRWFLERLRLGLRLINVGIAAVFVGWLVVNRGALPILSVVQAVNFTVIAVALWVMRDPKRRTLNQVVGFVAYTVTIFATGAVGIIANDGTTPLLILVGMAVIAAVIVPWRPLWHLSGMVLTVVAAIWTVTVISPQPLFWLRNAGAIAPTLIAAVYLSRAFTRQRDDALLAARERAQREARLTEANRRLEREIDEHRKTERALRMTTRELDHRVKNTLATVQSIAQQTLHTSTTMDEFCEAFSGRIQALARIHGSLSGRHQEGLRVDELVELIVGPYRHQPDRVRIDCDGSFVPPDLVRSLGMALHELATNAAKYGALSNAAGRVAISARSAPDGGGRLHIDWSEQGGPPTDEPARRGFGTRLIEEALAHEAGGRVALRFPPDGLRCEIDLPLPAPA